jgi:FkbM family methyltransferase
LKLDIGILGRGALYLTIATSGVGAGVAFAYGRLSNSPVGRMAAAPYVDTRPSSRPHFVLNYCPGNWHAIARAYEQKVGADVGKMEKAVRQIETAKDFGGLRLLDTEKGSFWVPTRETNVLYTEVTGIANGEYGSGDDDVQPNDVVLDCGAHFGAFTRHALDKGAKLVVAIDINPMVLECLKRTFAKEIASGRVIVFGKGVWNKDEELPMRMPAGSEASTVVLGGVSANVTVPLTKIDSMMSELKLPRVDFIKMDVEGAEQPAIEGAAEVIRKFKPRMAIAAYHRDVDPYALPLAVRAIDSDYWLRMPRCFQRSWLPPTSVTIPEVAFFRHGTP